MKKFHFNLESVLKVREREAKQKLAEFAAVQSRVNVYHHANIKMQEEYVVQEEFYLEKMKTGFRAEEGWMFDRYIKRIAEQSRQNKEEIEKLQPLLNEAKQIYETAYKKKKAVEILKEQRFQEYKKALIKEEQDESDEISTGILSYFQMEQENKKNSENKKEKDATKIVSKEDELYKDAEDERLLELFESLKKTSSGNSFEGFKKRFNL